MRVACRGALAFVIIVHVLARGARADGLPIERYVSTMIGYEYVAPSGPAGGSIRVTSEHLLLTRIAAGIEIGATECVTTRIGATAAVHSDDWDLELDLGPGLEVQVEYPLSPRWRIGGRVGADYFVLRGRPVASGGVRLRSASVSFGLDAALLGTGKDRQTAPGVVASVGLEGRPARYGAVIEAAALLLAGVVAFSLRAEGD